MEQIKLVRDLMTVGVPTCKTTTPIIEVARFLIEHNVEAVRAKGARKIVFACPTCYQVWQEHYPSEFETAHFTAS